MSWYKSALQESLNTGFIDQVIQSNKAYRPQLVVNDRAAGKKVLTTIERELRKCDEFWFSVAFVTTSGLATLMNTLLELEEKGIKGKVLASQYLNFTQPEALKRILKFKNIELRIVTDGDFHSKGYLFKKGDLFDLIIGSSNLTANALCSNKEWNLKVTAAEQSELITQTIKEFQSEFACATIVTKEWLVKYDLFYRSQLEYNRKIQEKLNPAEFQEVKPNLMQREALENIKHLRKNGKQKALLISATGTGKTYLSAFDVKAFQPRKFLFIVHRQNITKKAMETYQNIFGETISMGLYSGNKRELEADFIFSTVQTISKDEHLQQFAKDHFNYIVIDETHRAGASSYQKIMDYFTPDFLLGMTATPERTDGLDVFKLFEYNIAYEIRLHKALEEDMLSPFHYYGVTDLSINGQIIEDKADFNLLTATERVNRILEKAELYGCDDGNVRGLIFCSRKEEAHALSLQFNARGYQTIALTGDDAEEKRADAIRRLESDQKAEKLDYIFTVDIFNEGIDIPLINQIIMLRPTQSAIIFVQQLGRGLRKVNNKEYLTVIDFIGNYSNNYLVPVALYGDTTYNKDTLRNLLSTGSQLMPGSSTINFDKITKEKIFSAIDSANLQLKKDLVNDYKLLKFKLGRIPTLTDFIEHGSRDPYAYISYAKSYYHFLVSVENDLHDGLNGEQQRLLAFFSQEINNAKRIEETVLLELLLSQQSVTFAEVRERLESGYKIFISEKTIASCIRNLNFDFVTQNHEKQMLPLSQIYGIHVVDFDGKHITMADHFLKHLDNEIFREHLQQTIACALLTYSAKFDHPHFDEGFQLYRKYSRKDVFRILNWETNPVAQNVGGYIISPDKSNCPVFVNYHKHENISSTTKYEDIFLNNREFQWMSKSKRTLESSDVKTIRNYQNGLRIPLFIKKSNDEGTEFYYMGDVTPIDESFEQTTLPTDDGKKVSVVKLVFKLKHAVEDHLYEYLTDEG
jgi:superfamily II DNA or RNA helicase/HKD family nuclease